MASNTFSADVNHDGTMTEIRFAGRLDELASGTLEAALGEMRTRVRINFREVTRISSYGIGLLMRCLGNASSGREIEFTECSEVVVDQFQMLDFSRYGRITSFYARYYCSRCDKQDEVLLVIARDLAIDRASSAVQAPEFACSCGGTSTVDDSLEFVIDHLD